MSGAALPGFRDFYPAEFAQRAWLFERWRDVCRRFGYAETDGPPLEPLELYTKKSGAEIVGQLYAFEDRGGRQVALRPEMTPTVARMVAARANALRKPVRWFSIPQLFRYERQQKGRLREHFQLNVDIFGESDIAADAELLAVACEVMRACGLDHTAVRARWSDRIILNSILRSVGVPDVAAPAAYAAIDKIGREDQSLLERKMIDAGIDSDVATELLRIVKASHLDVLGIDVSGDAAVLARLDDLRRYQELLGAYGVSQYAEFDLKIVRGLAYYTGIVFELFDAHGKHRAICGGGRYDNLLSSLGGVDMPALGFGMGDVVLGDLLSGAAPKRDSIDYWVGPATAGLMARAIQVAATLRRQYSQRVEVPLRFLPIGKQKAQANRSGADKFIVIHTEDDCSLDGMTSRFHRDHVDIASFLKGGGPVQPGEMWGEAKESPGEFFEGTELENPNS